MLEKQHSQKILRQLEETSVYISDYHHHTRFKVPYYMCEQRMLVQISLRICETQPIVYVRIYCLKTEEPKYEKQRLFVVQKYTCWSEWSLFVTDISSLFLFLGSVALLLHGKEFWCRAVSKWSMLWRGLPCNHMRIADTLTRACLVWPEYVQCAF